MRKRVQFRLTDTNEIQIGYLVKDKEYKNGYKVVSGDKKSSYAISLLDMIRGI